MSDMLDAKALETGAAVEAKWDGREFSALGNADRARYINRFGAGLSAYLAASPQPASSAQVTEMCQTCQGNGEIVTDWDTYLQGDDDEKSTATCPDCDGDGKVTAATGAGGPAVVVKPLEWAIAEIEGRTRYDNDDQFDNALEEAKKALSASTKGTGANMYRAPVDDDELQEWANLRADDAGRLARELVGYRLALTAAIGAGGQAVESRKCAICGGPHDNDLLSDICQDCESSAPWCEDTHPAPSGQAVEPRKGFPVLGSGGQKVDWQLVADHGEQARKNHYQSVERLAARGGLSWTELYAVLHDTKWQKMDTNYAITACRALETRYLSALSQPHPADERVVEALREALTQIAYNSTDEIAANIARAALSIAPATADGWREIGEDHPVPPHDVSVLLWSPPSLNNPNGLIEARPYSTGRRGIGWSEYSQHSWATHWMPLPAAPTATGGR